jgi:hypothetical protein
MECIEVKCSRLLETSMLKSPLLKNKEEGAFGFHTPGASSQLIGSRRLYVVPQHDA